MLRKVLDALGGWRRRRKAKRQPAPHRDRTARQDVGGVAGRAGKRRGQMPG